MRTSIKINNYNTSLRKRVFNLILPVIGLILLIPAILIIVLFIKLSSRGPIFFKQYRIGKNGKDFKTLMFRTMYPGAERDQKKFQHLNEADGPVFKIEDDPRFVGIGKFLARSGLDELPQLVNVIRGDMSLVGPRPLPIAEAKKLTKKQKVRELIKPGMTSSWVVAGAHQLNFSEWMKLDQEYVKSASLSVDLTILTKTILLVSKLIFSTS